jgi:CHAT domain-containing protein
MDELTLSYAASARALGYSRRLAASAPAARLLVIDEPRPVTQGGPLPNSAAEANAIASLFSASEVTPVLLAHERATRQGVLTSLLHADVAHFSCHGSTDWAEPLRSGLLMAHDVPVTAADILGLHLKGARLASLSACETGIIGARLPDEVVALPTALIQAGFAGVLATLWSVSDTSTAMLMERFYHLWRKDSLDPAAALQTAQQWLRDTSNAEKAEHFSRDITTLSGVRMPEAVAAEFFSEVLSQAMDVRSFQHPVYWAAFYLSGV